MLIRRTTSIVALVGAQIVFLILLMRLGSYSPGPADWGQLGPWLSDTAPEDALVAAVRLLALGLAWWLTASTLLYGLARLTQVTALIRGVRWVTLPPLRRVIDGMVATTVVASTTFGGGRVAMAEPVPVGPVVVQLDQQADPPPEVATSKPAYQPRPAGDSSDQPQPSQRHLPDNGRAPAGPSAEGVSSGPSTRSNAVSPSTTGSTAPQRRAEEPSPPSPPTMRQKTEGARRAAATYVVQPGDNLWKIARYHLATPTGQPVEMLTAAEVGGYWIEVVETNRHALRSGNPDLIYPGEAIALP